MNQTRNRTEHRSLNITISHLERRWLLFVLDLSALNGAFFLSLIIRPDYRFSWQLIAEHPEWLLTLNALWLLIGYFFQVYQLEKASQPRMILPAVWGAGLITLLVFSFLPYLPPKLSPSRLPLYLSILLPVLFLTVSRGIYLLIFSQPIFRRRVLIVGAGWAGRTIFKALHDHGENLYDLVGFIDDDPEKQGRQVEIDAREDGVPLEQPVRLPVLGGRDRLQELIAVHRINMVVLAITRNVSGELLQVITDTLQQGVELTPMPVLYEQLTGKVPVEHIGDQWSVSIPVDHPGTRALWHLSKRVFDLFWAGIGLAGLFLLSPLIALLIYLDSPGPILYSQQRMGRNGRLFRVYKFRSMIPDAEQNSPVWAEENDSRVTRIGRLLRKTHLDEFPQFVNILKGEMSVVGPRPERPEFVKDLAAEIPFYRVRLAVKPGMAGWGLIHQGYGASREDALVKLQYDLYYIKHQSLWLDFYILARTFLDALSLGGR